jgi:Holliday junction resolvase
VRKGAKAKGSAAERELLDTLFEHGYAVLRAAGSGSTQHDACDLVAGRGGKAYAIEVKACAGTQQYISAEQMQELLTFAAAFGAEPLVAVKWTRRGWGILSAEKLRKTGKHWAVQQSDMETLPNWLTHQTMGFRVE